MIRLIQSKRLKLPEVFFVENSKDLEDIPVGVPFIRGNPKDYDKYVQSLEWDCLWETLKKSDFKLKWNDLLRDNGFTPIKFGFSVTTKTDLFKYERGILEGEEVIEGTFSVDSKDFISDSTFKVELDVIKSLHLLPYWFDTIEESVNVNLPNTILYNPNLFTKKLGIPAGDFELAQPTKSIIIIDISGSIPRAISSNLLVYAKTFAEMFYADLLITGSKSKIYDYSILDSLDVEGIYNECGMNNEQKDFVRLIKEPREYSSAIVFGDHHYPGDSWAYGDSQIPEAKGKEMCQWRVGELISFHVDSSRHIAGYGRWFDVPEGKIRKMENWTTYLN